ncbi:MAG: flavin reductase family protein [Candidatus Thermoplasmatota archaeon]|nr:flavin reductase family protein [Candidatus Thermoplasmatota archaeon]
MSKNIRVNQFYGFIAPRPTVCVSTVDENGNANIAPYSFVIPLSFDPPLIGIGSAPTRDTTHNSRETGEFVVSPVTESWKEEAIKTEVSLPREESEFDEVGLTEKSSQKVEAPSVEEAPVNIECELQDEFEVGDHVLLAGKVVNIECDESSLKNDRLDLEDLGALGHIKGEEFHLSKTMTEIDRG